MMSPQSKISLLSPVSLRTRRKRLYHARPFFLSIAVLSLLTIGSLIARSFDTEHSQSVARDNAFGKRMVYLKSQDEDSNSSKVLGPLEQDIECRLVRYADDQCLFVKSNCPDENGIFPYLQLYYCSLRHVQPIAFVILVAWLSLLFSTIGIAASDFLCINLSTIASILGMSESLTGVTFLAFGNGSPDVFSTFAAMGSNSGSLAVGELVGAACFISAVVAGSMALVRPFRVARRSFVRDVGFFIIAATLALIVLADGELHVWECATMVGLYAFYVLLVVSWHWYLTHQRRKYEREIAARAHFHIPESQELDLEEPSFDDDPVAGESSSLLQSQRSPDFEALERLNKPAWEDDEDDDETRNRYLAEIRENMRVTRPSSFTRRKTLNSIRPSLVGALEFQSVLSSLQKSKNIHEDTIDLRQYLDNDSAGPSPKILARSYRSRSSLQQRTEDSTRQRSASMRHTPNLQLDTSFDNARTNDGTLSPADATLSNHIPSHSSQTQPLPHRPATPTSLLPIPQSHTTRQTSSVDHLVVPQDEFPSPNLQVSPRTHLLSPSGLSPLVGGHTLPIPATFEQGEESDNDTIRFPSFVESPRSISPRPSSLNLPAALLSPIAGHRNPFSDEDDHQASALETMFFTLFPTLCDWKTKTFWGKIVSIVAVPSVLCLTITIPVVDPTRPDSADTADDLPSSAEPPPGGVSENEPQQPTPMIRLPDESPTLRPQDHQALGYGLRQSIEHITPVGKSQGPPVIPSRPRIDSELAANPLEATDGSSSTTTRSWHRGLTTIQTFTSPLFVILAIWSVLDDGHNLWNLVIPIVVSLGGSLVCAILLNIFLRGHDDLSQAPKQLRPFLSFVGFIVGICWIAIIADEVVSLLKSVGVILNISDSLLGLTVFAVGNSLSDLVADITVARLGYPVMALSACFGGPMLNILLGIGIGGLYMTLHSNSRATNDNSDATATITRLSRHVPYKIVISKTLVISGVSLLITLVGLLIIVPLNHWKMDRKIGYGLIVLWSLSTLGNVIVELVT